MGYPTGLKGDFNYVNSLGLGLPTIKFELYQNIISVVRYSIALNLLGGGAMKQILNWNFQRLPFWLEPNDNLRIFQCNKDAF